MCVGGGRERQDVSVKKKGREEEEEAFTLIIYPSTTTTTIPLEKWVEREREREVVPLFAESPLTKYVQSLHFLLPSNYFQDKKKEVSVCQPEE